MRDLFTDAAFNAVLSDANIHPLVTGAEDDGTPVLGLCASYNLGMDNILEIREFPIRFSLN